MHFGLGPQSPVSFHMLCHKAPDISWGAYQHQIVLLGKGSVRVWEFIVAIEPTSADCYCCQVELRPQLHLAQGFPDIPRWHLDDLDCVCRGEPHLLMRGAEEPFGAQTEPEILVP